MYIIQVSNNNVVDILRVRDDATNDTIKVVSEIPAFEHKDGYSGVLKFDDEQGLYWEYVENIPDDEQEVSAEELKTMIEEVL